MAGQVDDKAGDEAGNEAGRQAGRASTSAGASSSANKDNTGGLEGHVLDFPTALLDHDMGDNEYQSALSSGLAVLGNPPGHGWRNALVYRATLSAIVTVARTFASYKAKRAGEDEIRCGREVAGESEAEARRRARRHLDRVREMVRRFVTIVA